MLGRAPEEVAKFLAKTAGLNKTMIGEYLGEREEACLRVMHAYVDAMDFAGSEFDTAIRCVRCRPPGRHVPFLAACSAGCQNRQPSAQSHKTLSPRISLWLVL